MNNESTKKRGWIKNAAIIFLLVLLLLTFFSNTIMTYSLPEVSAQYGQYGSLSSSVKLDGTIKANESYKVIYEPTDAEAVVQSRKVKSVYVREGDMVEKDQTILSVEGGASSELEALRKQYDELKKSYDLAVIGDNVSYLQTSRTLEEAQKQYDDAKAALDKLNVLYKKIMSGAATEADKAARAEELKNQKKQLEKRISDIDERIASLEAKIAEAKGQITGDESSTALTMAEKEFEGISSSYESLKSEEETLSKQLTTLRKSVDAMREANGLTNEIKQYEEQNAVLYADFEANYAEINANNEKIAEARQKLSIIGQSEVSDIDLFAAEHNLADLEERHNAASAELQTLAPEYESAKTELESLRRRVAVATNVSEYSDVLETYKEQREELQTELDSLGDPDDIASQVKAAEATVKRLKTELDIASASTYQQNQSTYLDRNEQKKQLDKLSEEIKKYEKAPETLGVSAPIAGRVVAVYTVPGESISSGTTVADIEIADKGYTCEITVTTEEARKIAVGSPVTVANSWWYSNIEASITQIRSDVQSQGKNKIVIFEVNGDVFDGQQVSFQVGDRTASYDCVVPNSAIHKDNEGDYVLTVESKKSPLGMRYKAKRVDIEVIASDDTKTAISGLLGGEFVITNATKPITDGQMVRLADN